MASYLRGYGNRVTFETNAIRMTSSVQALGSLSKGQNVNKTQDAKLSEKRIIKPTILL